MQTVGPDWIDYVKAVDAFDTYDGMCECFRCKQIWEEYWRWKSVKDKVRESQAENSTVNGWTEGFPTEQRQQNPEN